MENKNKIILAHYINIGNLDSSDIENFLKKYQENVKNSDILQYFIPMRNGKTRVECVYPIYVVGERTNEEFKGVIKKLNKCVKNLDLIKRLHPVLKNEKYGKQKK